jgi:hypothetical protein
MYHASERISRAASPPNAFRRIASIRYRLVMLPKRIDGPVKTALAVLTA